MTRIATMGTSSCATIAIAGFKDPEVVRNKEFLNFQGEEIPAKYDIDRCVEDVHQFYQKVIFPTSQPLGHTDEWPFDLLMQAIDKHIKLDDKFTIITLNQYQESQGYWPERLKAWGFEVMDVTKNKMGSVCYIYVRNRARQPLPSTKAAK